MSKAKQSRKDAPETDDYICFESGGKNGPWVNAQRWHLTESSGPYDAIFIDSFCGDDLLFGPIQARNLANKILGWCDEMENK